MANSQLYNKVYRIPDSVLKYIYSIYASNQNQNSDGVKRAKNLLKNKSLTYQNMKRLKNFFDTYNNNDKLQYELAGGDLMKSFIDVTLDSDRQAVKNSKEVRRDSTVDLNLGTKAYRATPELNESEEKKVEKNSLAIIFNKDNKVLLLKRSDNPKQWMPGKWALVGGRIEKNETPEQACKREIKEETGLDIDKLKKTFSIQRPNNNFEYIFACRYKDDEFNVDINNESSSYGWFDLNEIKFLDIVPDLIEYITLAFKKY